MPARKKAPEQGELALPKRGPELKMYTVPRGTNPAKCAGHRRGGTCEKVVYWITYDAPDRKHPGQTREVKQPIYCDVPGGEHPTASLPGRGHSHYVDCLDRGLFGR